MIPLSIVRNILGVCGRAARQIIAAHFILGFGYLTCSQISHIRWLASVLCLKPSWLFVWASRTWCKLSTESHNMAMVACSTVHQFSWGSRGRGCITADQRRRDTFLVVRNIVSYSAVFSWFTSLFARCSYFWCFTAHSIWCSSVICLSIHQDGRLYFVIFCFSLRRFLAFIDSSGLIHRFYKSSLVVFRQEHPGPVCWRGNNTISGLKWTLPFLQIPLLGTVIDRCTSLYLLLLGL